MYREKIFEPDFLVSVRFKLQTGLYAYGPMSFNNWIFLFITYILPVSGDLNTLTSKIPRQSHFW